MCEKKRNKRYVYEGVWSGYRPGQERVCYRVTTKRPRSYEQLHTIQFNDNTCIHFALRECARRERVKEIKGYSSLVRDALQCQKGFVRVSELQ